MDLCIPYAPCTLKDTVVMKSELEDGTRCQALRMKENEKGDACGHDDPRQGNDEAKVTKNNDGSLFVDLFHQAFHVLQA